jgi:hypothetical protein
MAVLSLVILGRGWASLPEAVAQVQPGSWRSVARRPVGPATTSLSRSCVRNTRRHAVGSALCPQHNISGVSTGNPQRLSLNSNGGWGACPLRVCFSWTTQSEIRRKSENRKVCHDTPRVRTVCTEIRLRTWLHRLKVLDLSATPVSRSSCGIKCGGIRWPSGRTRPSTPPAPRGRSDVWTIRKPRDKQPPPAPTTTEQNRAFVCQKSP